MDPFLIYIARNDDHSLYTWSELPEWITPDYKSHYWEADEVEGGSIDEDFFEDIAPGEYRIYELQEIMKEMV